MEKESSQIPEAEENKSESVPSVVVPPSHSSSKSEDQTENIGKLPEDSTTTDLDIIDQEPKINGSVHVVGIELNESCHGNGRLSPVCSKSSSRRDKTDEVSHRELLLKGSVPANSQILVSDAHTENVAAESSSMVFVESKMTLNVITNVDENESVNGAIFT